MDLTEEALDRLDEIYQLLYEEIDLIKKSGVQEWIWQVDKDLWRSTLPCSYTLKKRTTLTHTQHTNHT